MMTGCLMIAQIIPPGQGSAKSIDDFIMWKFAKKTGIQA